MSPSKYIPIHYLTITLLSTLYGTWPPGQAAGGPLKI